MRIDRIYRHPVKSVGSERLESVTLAPGEAMPGDRMFAVAHGKSDWDSGQPEWMRCRNFVRIANVPALAAAEITFEPERNWLKATAPGAPEIQSDLGSAAGGQGFADWVGQVTGDALPGPFSLAALPGGTLTDSSWQTPSLMSLASLRALEERMGVTLDPRRFRGNFWVDDAEPWAELAMQGQEIAFGEVVLRVGEPIVRCIATNANPETGARDANPLPPLKRMHGEALFGVLVEIVAGGELAAGMDRR